MFRSNTDLLIQVQIRLTRITCILHMLMYLLTYWAANCYNWVVLILEFALTIVVAPEDNIKGQQSCISIDTAMLLEE